MDRILERLLMELAGHIGPLKGAPVTKIVTGTDVAANTEIAAADFTVPAGKIWVPRSFTVVCVQGATQTPLPALAWDDGTTVLGSVAGAAAALSASTTARFTWLRSLLTPATAGAGLTANVAPMPKLILAAGYRLTTITAGKGANTDYGVPTLVADEYSV